MKTDNKSKNTNCFVNNKHGYGVIHKHILQSDQLTWKGKLVYSLLSAYAGNKQKCWPSLNTIIKDLGISRNSVIAGIREIEYIGIIEKLQFKNHNEYCFKSGSGDELLSDESSSGDEPGSSPDEPQVVQEMNPGSSGDEPEEQQEEKHSKNNIKELHKRLTEFFLEFYKQHKQIDYYWTGKDAGSLKQLLNKIKRTSKKYSGRDPTEDEILAVFQGILNKAYSDKWIKEHFEPAIINSKFNEIAAKGKQDDYDMDEITRLIDER